MPGYTYYQLDVFARSKGGGNPLGVVFTPEPWEAARMQRLARWTNLVETTFVEPSDDADYRVRIFTPTRELPFAGHPSVGTAHAWLEHGGQPGQAGQILQQCGAGRLPVRIDEAEGRRRISVQASIGIVDQLTTEAASATVLTQAVAALRRAKHDGRNRYALHVPAIETIDQERSHLEFDLAHALPEGQMHVVFQPYLSLETGEITGAEALLRWRHPTRGDIRPTSFVPLAEATGLILPLGAWTLRTALALAARWPEGLALSVNISALQFHQPHFVEEIDAALARSGFPAERLELEITETVLMRDNAQTVSQLEALIERGIRIALDDFGTGYSALAYLARLPHHRIKLDRSFVQDLANPATAELIRAIIASARGQGVAITAEGIETPAQLEAVRAFGFTHAQGFATGAPIADPTEAFSRVPA